MGISLTVTHPVTDEERAIIGVFLGDEAEVAAAEVEEKPAKPAKTTKAAKAEEPTGPTVEEVRTALKAYSALEGKPAAVQILADHDADSITELDPDHYQTVIDACNAED